MNYILKNAIIFKSILFIIISSCAVQDDYHTSFFEDFNNPSPVYFEFHSAGNSGEFTRTFGIESPSEPGSSILSFKIDPMDSAGAGRGPEIISKKFTHFGTYATRLKVPDVREIQPNVGAVVGYFTYHMDKEKGLSEIDVEWLIADPKVIYVGTWTGKRGALRRVGRTINLAEGIIYSTTTRIGHQGERTVLTGEQNQPETIQPIEDFDASSQFHTYGFDWHPDNIRWWMIHPVSADTVILWDYRGKDFGIPPHPSRYRLNFWYTDEWPVHTNPKSTDRPLNPYEVEIDWMSYRKHDH